MRLPLLVVWKGGVEEGSSPCLCLGLNGLARILAEVEELGVWPEG